MRDLTKKQTEILQILRKFIDEHGYSPTVRELASSLHIRSPSAIFKQLKSLERKGAIRQSEKKARSTELVRPQTQGSSEKKIAVIGSISQEEKIELFTKLHEVAFPEALLPKETNQYFGFFVKDVSFQHAALLQGDILAIETRSDVNNRETVLATDAKGFPLIGLFSKEKTGLKIGQQSFQDSEVKILGVLVAQIRNYS